MADGDAIGAPVADGEAALVASEVGLAAAAGEDAGEAFDDSVGSDFEAQPTIASNAAAASASRMAEMLPLRPFHAHREPRARVKTPMPMARVKVRGCCCGIPFGCGVLAVALSILGLVMLL